MLPDPPLLLVTDRAQARGDLLGVVAAACSAGCRWISLREKDLPAAEQLALFGRLREVTLPSGARLTLHGPPDLAHAAGADGVHLSSGGDGAAARGLLGRAALVGLSTHAPAEAARADPSAIDYVTASPVFATASKPGHGPALGPDGLAAFIAAARVPVVALGGVEAGTAPACREAGAAGIAVMGAVMRAADPGEVLRRLRAAFSAGST